ncbi:hypothetical protein DB723_04575 (plasmid) [Borrelia maritima]|uniref:Uncharacterized protein n=1 Tax=Borrelia maritima TaxID=2761123 RepID=A0A5J6WFU8_9SPIR|nr:hypothetical protein DB723_04575 [Borrelia maritima]
MFSKIILKFFNENLKKANQISITLNILKKHLYKLEKEINIITKFYTKNNHELLVYYKMNYPMKKIYFEIGRHFII